MRADNSETIATELLRARWTNKKSHIAPRLSQSATKVTTHRTGADDKDSHSGEVVSRCLIVGSRTKPLGTCSGSVNGESNEFGIQVFRS